ncbi:MAG: SpoIID/LytB domain-containing protein [Calditrichaeota bacterium]|nr:MAG: SpoIID/LytB domain-containing protein [Calditrichota bacterium]MBL1204356.1 SpoIID/LytB domain-containing protein [Calditrichota bacterium]NOG44185.1 SpoIID/LytB domain-containing protein [Calditrichota bacterium]
MLIPDIIPDQEPQINVGIILPEDNITDLTLHIPSNDYQIFLNNQSYNLAKESVIILEFIQGEIHLAFDQQKISTQAKIEISPKNKISPSNKSGIKVRSVIAGRGFHWQKFIEVFLPDTVIVNIIEDSLILINQMPLEHYVMCVATSEMGAECPEALIEAQTVAARSWLLANVEQKHRHMEMDICNDDCCQRYQGTTFLTEQSKAGALNTSGQVIVYDNKICDARYSKSCGGMMESFGYIWPGNDEDYLQAIPDSKNMLPELEKPLSEENNFSNWVNSTPHAFCSSNTVAEKDLKKYLGSVDEEGEYFRWQKSVSQKELKETIYNFAGISVKSINKLEIISRGMSGRINKLNIHYLDHNDKANTFRINSEYDVRRYLSTSFLYSSAITISEQNIKNGIPQDFLFNGAGWGHGVGLCQIGALGMSLNNYKSEEILYHYYPGSLLKKIY